MSDWAFRFNRFAGCITPGHKESRHNEQAGPPAPAIYIAQWHRGEILSRPNPVRTYSAEVTGFDAAISRIIAVRPYRRSIIILQSSGQSQPLFSENARQFSRLPRGSPLGSDQPQGRPPKGAKIPGPQGAGAQSLFRPLRRIIPSSGQSTPGSPGHSSAPYHSGPPGSQTSAPRSFA